MRCFLAITLLAVGLGPAACTEADRTEEPVVEAPDSGDTAAADPAPDAEISAGGAAEDAAAPEVESLAWLDENTGERALAWVAAENDKTLGELTADPRLAAFEAEAAAVMTAPDRLPDTRLHDGMIYDYRQDETHVFGLWRRTSYEAFLAGAADWEVLLDLDALSAEDGKEWILKSVAFAPGESTRCLLSIAHKGQDAAVIREFDLATRSFVADGFVLPESKSRVWWQDADTLILGAALPEAETTESGYARQLVLWQRGTPWQDGPVLSEVAHEDYSLFPVFGGLAGEGRMAVAHAPDFFARRYVLRQADGMIVDLPLPAKLALMGVVDGRMILLLKQDWAPSDGVAFENGDLVTLPSEALFDRLAVEDPALLYRPAADEQVRDVRVLDGVVHLNLLKDVRGRIVALEPGAAGSTARLLDSVPDGFIRFGPITPDGTGVLATYEGFFSPPALYRVAGGTGEKTPILAQAPAFDTEGLTIETHAVSSADGTEIPYTILKPAGPVDGTTPLLVYGYGGFEVTVTPRYEPVFGKLWLEKGGIYVHAHLRGGGEFGPRWHDAPMLDQRPRVYEDMAAVLADLHARGYSAPAHTGIMGRSNGGLMVAAVMTRDADLMNAVVVGGPLIDMLTYDKLGPGASWTAEYGDPDNPAQRAFIETYSPIQKLTEDADYPRPLVITSTYDDRVWPGHARRFAARMEALGHDALYYEDMAGGHYWELAGGPGPGDWRKRAKARAVEFVYLARELGLAP